jgi:hypothetical protein
MHVDYITPVNGTKPEVLNISFIPDGFNSSFSLSQDSKTGGSTTHQTSWSAGVAESGSASVQWGDVDKGSGEKFSMAFNAAQDFAGSTENSNNNYATSHFDVTVATKKGDQVFYDDSRLNIWVYPVIGETACPAAKPACTAAEQQPLTLQFSGPDKIDTGVVSTEDAGSFWYQPPWEFGNVFSYPATGAQLALIYPDLAKTQLSNDVSFKTNPSSVKIQATWGSGSEQGSTSSTTDNFSFDGKTSFVVAAGAKGIGQVTTKESIKVTGSYGFGTLQTNTAQVEASTGIGITSTAIFPDTSNYGYKVTPYILGSTPPAGVGDARQPPLANIQTFGPLKTAFTADPIDLTLGGSWWTAPYASAPDVALNHPNRWVLTEPGLSNPIPNNCGNGGQNASQMDCVDIAPYFDDAGNPVDPWVSNFYSMRGLFISDAENTGPAPQLGFATAGDKLNLAVRVYNYSLMKVVAGNHVHVRFYAMPVDASSGNPLGDSLLLGESVVDPIPPFQDSTADLNWRLVQCPTPWDTTPYAGRSFAFWVVVWMEDSNGNLVPEIQGHGLKSIPGKLTKPSDVHVEMATATDGQTAVSYSNNVGFYHYAFSVLSPSTGLGAPESNNPTDVVLKNVSFAKQRVKPGELNEITAVLRAGLEREGGHSKVYFYDGDPHADGKLIGTEIARLKPYRFAKVRIPYHAPTQGIHQIWAVVNKGGQYQMERHTEDIFVKSTADEHRPHRRPIRRLIKRQNSRWHRPERSRFEQPGRSGMRWLRDRDRHSR